MKHLKCVFFGVGAVSSVMAQALFELSSKRSEGEVSFVFVIRDPSVIQKYFFAHDKLLEVSHFLEASSFETIFSNPSHYEHYFNDATVFINASISVRTRQF